MCCLVFRTEKNNFIVTSVSYFDIKRVTVTLVLTQLPGVYFSELIAIQTDMICPDFRHLHKMRSATFRLKMSVRMEKKPAPIEGIFMKFDISVFFENLLGKFKFR